MRQVAYQYDKTPAYAYCQQEHTSDVGNTLKAIERLDIPKALAHHKNMHQVNAKRSFREKSNGLHYFIRKHLVPMNSAEKRKPCDCHGYDKNREIPKVLVEVNLRAT